MEVNIDSAASSKISSPIGKKKTILRKMRSSKLNSQITPKSDIILSSSFNKKSLKSNKVLRLNDPNSKFKKLNSTALNDYDSDKTEVLDLKTVNNTNLNRSSVFTDNIKLNYNENYDDDMIAAKRGNNINYPYIDYNPYLNKHNTMINKSTIKDNMELLNMPVIQNNNSLHFKHANTYLNRFRSEERILPNNQMINSINSLNNINNMNYNLNNRNTNKCYDCDQKDNIINYTLQQNQKQKEQIIEKDQIISSLQIENNKLNEIARIKDKELKKENKDKEVMKENNELKIIIDNLNNQISKQNEFENVLKKQIIKLKEDMIEKILN